EALRGLVVLVDDAVVAPGQLGRSLDDGGQHRLQIQRRADRPADLAERLELAHRPREVSRARLQLLEQPDVLDRDDRLVGEYFQQVDVGVGEAPRLAAGDYDRADGVALTEHRYREEAPEGMGDVTGIFRVCQRILDLGDGTGQYGSTRGLIPPGRSR